ncbi:hypothetical protein V8C43DRAFT_35088 [Trichoderma afarasin]
MLSNMTGPPQKLTGANISDSREEPHKLIYSNFVPWMLLEALFHLSLPPFAEPPLRRYAYTSLFMFSISSLAPSPPPSLSADLRP